MRRITLVLGGARSGKSRFAEALAAGHPGPKTYIATAEAFDDEMRARILQHQQDRASAGWMTIEEPLGLPVALERAQGFILLDCVTVWLGNLFHHRKDISASVAELCRSLRQSEKRVVLVSNEVGLSIVPENAMARRFRDEQGLANQRLAEVADEVFFIAAGLPMKLKG
jgi:adenosylcobinamide kinase/adenosylcobinamide-phosphate guanylyltransferase